MKKTDLRIKILKVCLSEDEKQRINEACCHARRSRSDVSRELITEWAAKQNDMRRNGKTEWPECGKNMAIPQAGRGRANYGGSHKMRRHL